AASSRASIRARRARAGARRPRPRARPPDSGRPDRAPMSRHSLVPVVVAALTTICFIPALSGSFLNWDDNVNFLDNLAYRGLGREQIHWAFTSVLFGHYIPLTRLSWSLNYVTGGLDPWGYHLLNLLLHATNTILFYLVARRLL